MPGFVFAPGHNLDNEFKALNLGSSATSSRVIGSGRSNASNSSMSTVNDTRPGGPGDLAKVATGPFNQYLPYFGPPTKVSGNNPGGLFGPARETFVYSEFYDQHSSYLAATFDLMIRDTNHWIFTKVIPLSHTDLKSFNWSFQRPVRTLPELQANLTTSRMVKIESTQRNTTLNRYGIGFMIENDFASTKQGQMHYAMLLNAMTRAFVDMAYLLILRSFWEYEQYYSNSLKTGMINNPSIQDSLRETHGTFACFIKDPDALVRVIELTKRIMAVDGVHPNIMIVPRGFRAQVYMNTHEKLNGSDKNSNVSNALAESSTYTFGGLEIYEVDEIVTEGNFKMNPMKNIITVGDYFKMECKDFVTLGGTVDQFVTAFRDITVLTMETPLGDLTPIKFSDAIAFGARFDENGELSSYHDDLIQAKKSGTLKNYSKIKPSELDMFLVEDNLSTDGCRKAVYWGDMHHHFLPPVGIKHAGSTIYNKLKVAVESAPEKTQEYIRQGLDYMRTLSTPDVSSDYFFAWIAGIKGGSTIESNTGALSGGVHDMPVIPIIKSKNSGNSSNKRSIFYKPKTNEVQPGDDGLLPVIKVNIKGILTMITDKDIDTINANAYIITEYSGYAIMAKIIQYINSNGIGDDDAVANCVILINKFLHESRATVDKFTEPDQPVTVPEFESGNLLPYGYGSENGLREIAELINENSNSGYLYRGISENGVDIAKKYINAVESMFTIVSELTEDTHPCLNPSYLPPWMVTGNTHNDSVNRMSQILHEYVDTSSIVISPATIPDTADAESNSERDPFARAAGTIVRALLNGNGPRQFFSADNITPDAEANEEEEEEEENITLKKLASEGEQTAWTDILGSILPFCSTFMSLAMNNIGDFNERYIELVGNSYITLQTDGAAKRPFIRRTGSKLGDLLSDIMKAMVSHESPLKTKEHAGCLLEFLAGYVNTGTPLEAPSSRTLSDGMNKLMFDNKSRVRPQGKVGDTGHGDVKIGVIDMVIPSKLVIKTSSFINFHNQLEKEPNENSRRLLIVKLGMVPPYVLESDNPNDEATNLIDMIVGRNVDTSDKVNAFKRAGAKTNHNQYSSSSSSSSESSDIGITKGKMFSQNTSTRPKTGKFAGLNEYKASGSLFDRKRSHHTSSSTGKNKKYRGVDGVGMSTTTNMNGGSMYVTYFDPSSRDNIIGTTSTGIVPNQCMMNNIGLIANVSDPIERLCQYLIILSKINMYQIQNWMDKDVLVPVDILIERPFKRYTAESAITCRGGSELGRYAYGSCDLSIGSDAKIKATFGSSTWYAAPVLENQKNYMIQPNVRPCAYHSGEGVEFYGPDWDKEGAISGTNRTKGQHNTEKPSCFSLICPYGSLSTPPRRHRNNEYTPGLLDGCHSITGRFRESLAAPIGQRLSEELPHYPSALYYDIVYQFSQLNENKIDLHPNREYSVTGDYNEIVWQGLEHVYNIHDPNKPKLLANKDPFGECAYPGVKPLRVGSFTTPLKKVDYAQYASYVTKN